MARKYDKLVKVSISTILTAVADENITKINVTPTEKVKVLSVRLHTFLKSLICVRCGLVGKHFWAERSGNNESYHVNLYAVREDGSEALMTKDHIIPRSRGGSDDISNMQTMCEKCNRKKGNTLEDGFDKLNHPVLPRVKMTTPAYTGLPSKSSIHRKPSIIRVGDVICKKSRKAFQNKKRVNTVVAFCTMLINPELKFTGVMLKGCASPVRVSGLSNDKREVKWLGKRDKTHPLPYKSRKEELMGNLLVNKTAADAIIHYERNKTSKGEPCDY